MPSYDYYDPMGTTGGGDGKYFQKQGKGRYGGYSLKPQYTSRLLGYGDSWSRNGALATYSNAYDDMWDSYEPMRDKRVYGIFENPAFQQPAPAPAPKAAPPAAAPKPTPKPVDNPYKKQADDLLKTIDKILAKPAPAPPPPPKPTTIFAGSTGMGGGDLQIAPATKGTKQTGTGAFKRRRSATPTSSSNSAGLRTVQSLNV